MSELVSNGVQIYQFPTDDEAVSEINASMNVSHVVTLKNVIQSVFLSFFFFLPFLPENTRCFCANMDGVESRNDSIVL